LTTSFHPTLVQTRVRTANKASLNADGDYVLYWMTMTRRPGWNYALQRAVDYAKKLNKPLIVLEPLRCDYRWNCVRFHSFIMEGMAANREAFKSNVTYYPYLEPEREAGKGLLKALGERACVVVGDDFPCYFLPHMLEAAARQLGVLFEVVDSNGLLPLSAAPKAFDRAVDFRRFLQKNLEPHLEHPPLADPLRGHDLRTKIPKDILERWPMARSDARPEDFPVNQAIQPVWYKGGHTFGELALKDFLQNRVRRYEDERSEPMSGVASGLSPYLHFGYVSAHQVLHELSQKEQWNHTKIAPRATGKKAGWWGMSSPAEAFLDEIVTWRELGYVFCHFREDYARYESLPEWALKTLAVHADDARPHVYTLKQLEQAETYDPLWNAAQCQLDQEGRIHNYLRMFWGKKVLEWSKTPQEGLENLIELNNKYAVDGRNPNSYSGIFWCFGRFDRPWFDRPIFGVVRYMSSDSTRKKFKVDPYIAKWSEDNLFR
jgi:deoxyribodipyrimidine photo-lyase